MMMLLAAIGSGKSIYSDRVKQHRETKLRTRNTTTKSSTKWRVVCAAYLDFILSGFEATTASQ